MIDVKGIPYYIYARICKVSYGYPEKRTAELQQLAPGWKILNEYTNNDILTVTNNKIVVVCFRGTELKKGVIRSMMDLYNDYGILAGENERIFRLDEARPIVQEIIKKYKKNKVVITGHSLGGFIGLVIAEQYKLKAVLFNIGSSPKDKRFFDLDKSTYLPKKKSKDIIHITTNNIRKIPPTIDILSVSSLYFHHIPYYVQKVKDGVSIHSIDNFT